MWNSTAADEEDESLAWGRLEEACEFAGNVKAIMQLHVKYPSTPRRRRRGLMPRELRES